MNVVDLGCIEYEAALEIQNRHVEDLLAGTGGEVLLLLEHEPVYTIGRTRDRSSLRERLPYPAIETNRGGQATKTYATSLSGTVKDVVSGTTLTVSGGQVSVTVPAMGTAVISTQ